MITTDTRHTLRDLINHGELDGYSRVTAMPVCSTCGGPMCRWQYEQEVRFLFWRWTRVRIVYECRSEWCQQADIRG